MKLMIEIDLENEAVSGAHGPVELGRILNRCAERIAAGDPPRRLMDANGNSVGTVSWLK